MGLFGAITEIVKVGIRMTLAIFILMAIFAILPPISIPDEALEAISWILGVLWTFDFLFPVGTLFEIILLLKLFDLVVISWNVIQWIFNKLNIIK